MIALAFFHFETRVARRRRTLIGRLGDGGKTGNQRRGYDVVGKDVVQRGNVEKDYFVIRVTAGNV